MPNAVKRSAPGDAASSGAPPAAKKARSDRDVQKYYAVRAGRKPGIYLLWPDCQAQISGFKGAQYKSFLTRSDAEAFVAGQDPPSSKNSAKGAPQPPKFYAVARGSFTGIFPDWTTASKAINGTKGPKYKKFESMTEAVQFIEQFGDADTIKKVKGAAAAGGAETAGAVGKKKTVKTAQETPEKLVGKDALMIYTDGSSLANGRAGAVAGVGVFFGLDDSRNVSERLQGTPQTNQRAELTAILRALQIAPTTRDVQILTDSQYSINCVTDWYKSWQRKGWLTSQGGEVKNRDLVKAVRERIDAREGKGSKTVFTWVKGHADDVGNQCADKLAVAGAKM